MTARHIVRSDLPALGDALGTAFVDDPMVAWVIGIDDPAARRAASIAGFFAVTNEAGLARGHTYTTGPVGGPLGGGAIWVPPDVEVFTDAEIGQLAPALIDAAGEDALGRLMALGEMVNGYHPHDRPHFYLFILGAVEKGRGVGSDVLQPVLERCDIDGLPAYLESSSARNISFYERHGFQVQWEDSPAPDGPVFRGMWREPGSRRG